MGRVRQEGRGGKCKGGREDRTKEGMKEIKEWRGEEGRQEGRIGGREGGW